MSMTGGGGLVAAAPETSTPDRRHWQGSTHVALLRVFWICVYSRFDNCSFDMTFACHTCHVITFHSGLDDLDAAVLDVASSYTLHTVKVYLPSLVTVIFS